jgi:hypothetical protein
VRPTVSKATHQRRRAAGIVPIGDAVALTVRATRGGSVCARPAATAPAAATELPARRRHIARLEDVRGSRAVERRGVVRITVYAAVRIRDLTRFEPTTCRE